MTWTAGGELAGALGRRVRAAAEAFRREDGAVLVATGGRVWDDVVEADAMRDALVRLGVPAERIVRERCSHTTYGNARFTSALLCRLGVDRAVLVTCDWHTPRATTLFRRFGVGIEAAPARSPRAGILTRVWRWGRERVATRVDGAATVRPALP